MMMDIFVNKLIFIRKGWNHCRKIIREMCCFGKNIVRNYFELVVVAAEANKIDQICKFLTTEHHLMQRLRIFHLV